MKVKELTQIKRQGRISPKLKIREGLDANETKRKELIPVKKWKKLSQVKPQN